MSTAIQPSPLKGILIPEWVVDIESFVRWTESPGFPKSGRISFLHGNVIVDQSTEQLFTHGRIKVCITAVFETIVRAMALGYVFSDRTRLHNIGTGLSVEPDVLFVSFDAIRKGRIALREGADDGYISLDGSPELIVEVVSESSEHKDTVELREGYFDAGVIEFWLVDARGGSLSFEILKRGSSGFIPTEPQPGGWLNSTVFGRSFRLAQAADPLGHPEFTLEHRD